MSCAVCGRKRDIIVGSIENKDKTTSTTVIEVLYLDSQNKVVCGRCVCDHYMVLRNNGDAIVYYKPRAEKEKWIVNKPLYNKANKEQYVSEDPLPELHFNRR